MILKDLNKQFDTKLFTIDNKFEHGKIYGLIGDNGSGKTTLLKMISGLDKDYEGSIEINNMKVGYLKESPYLFNMSVLDNIKYSMNIKNENNMKYLNEIITLLNIENLLDKKVSNLSKGEKTKVALARILVYKPDILLLDESSSGLDITSKKKFMDILKWYVKENDAIVIFASHDLVIINDLCDEVINIADYN